MRIAWAVLTLCTLLTQWNDVVWLYSKESFLGSGEGYSAGFSVLNWIADPVAVFSLYLLLLFLLLCVMTSVQTRTALILSWLLLLFFHQRNPMTIGGGDDLLFAIGFLLVIDSLFSGSSWGSDRNQTPNPNMMPIWPYRLLLWQIIVIYIFSFWSKLLGTMWIHGTAVSTALSHPHFARFTLPMELLDAISPVVGYIIMGWEALWLLLLLPSWRYSQHLLKFLLISGVLFHIGILIFLKVGSFSLAMMVAYIGLYYRAFGTSVET